MMKEYLNLLKEQVDVKKLCVGKHNNVPDSEFDENELKMGMEIETEHTNNPELAKAISKDHLSEIRDYYTRLKKMENEAKSK